MAVRELAVLSDAERQRLLVAWNRTEAAWPTNVCLHQLFEAQARLQPDAMALEHEGTNLGYGELNMRANQLARHLRTLGVGPDTQVAICARRGIHMVVAMLAVLKAGGAYVPMDPAYPAERLAHVLRDSEPLALLVDEQTP